MAVQYTAYDLALCDSAVLRFTDNTKIEFQYPPKISGDNRKGDWREGDMRGTEPVAVFEKSGPREITLTWTYIVDGGKWTTDKIAGQVRLIRGYFARVRDTNNQNVRNLVLYLKLWQLLPTDNQAQEASCRIKGVDVKHSDTLISQAGDGPDIDSTYPLRTDITIDLRLWTKGGPAETQDLEGIRTAEHVNWY